MVASCPPGQVLKAPLCSPQEADAVRDALLPGLACAAAHAGNLEALQALVELVRPPRPLGAGPSHASLGGAGRPGCARPRSRVHPDPTLPVLPWLPDPAQPPSAGGMPL